MTKAKAVTVKKVATQKVMKRTEMTESIRGLMTIMKEDMGWEAPLKALHKSRTPENLQAFYAAVGKDRIKAMRTHHAEFIRGKGKFETPEDIMAKLPEAIRELRYTANWKTMQADELSIIAGKHVKSFDVLYKAFSMGGELRPDGSRPAASFIAAKIGWAIIQNS